MSRSVRHVATVVALCCVAGALAAYATMFAVAQSTGSAAALALGACIALAALVAVGRPAPRMVCVLIAVFSFQVAWSLPVAGDPTTNPAHLHGHHHGAH